MATTKQIDKALATGFLYAIEGDDGKPVHVQFISRERSYVEYVENATGHKGKLHVKDITFPFA